MAGRRAPRPADAPRRASAGPSCEPRRRRRRLAPHRRRSTCAERLALDARAHALPGRQLAPRATRPRRSRSRPATAPSCTSSGPTRRPARAGDRGAAGHRRRARPAAPRRLLRAPRRRAALHLYRVAVGPRLARAGRGRDPRPGARVAGPEPRGGRRRAGALARLRARDRDRPAGAQRDGDRRQHRVRRLGRRRASRARRWTASTTRPRC